MQSFPKARKALSMALATLGMSMLAAPIPSHAAYSIADTNHTTGHGIHDQVDVSCPGDQHVTGGGLFSNGTYNETTIAGSRPFDDETDANSKPDDGWAVELDNGGGEQENVTVWAICTSQQLKYRFVPNLDGDTSESAFCPRPTVPVGGGVFTAGTFAQGVAVTSSAPLDGPDQDLRMDGWTGAWAQAAGDPVGAGVLAICWDANAPKYRLASLTLSPQSQSFGLKLCRPEERLLGGGFRLSSTGSVTPNSAYPIDGPDDGLLPDDGYRLIADNTLDAQPGASVFAVCRR